MYILIFFLDMNKYRKTLIVITYDLRKDILYGIMFKFLLVYLE